MNFAEKLKKLRDQSRLTQSEFASEIGVSLRTYKAYELGERRPRKHDIYLKIADIYDLDLNSLITDGEDLKTLSHIENNDKDADVIIKEMLGLFSGGKLDLEDKKAVLDSLEEAYYIAKMKEEKNE
ncbi:helix-turn-helix transcriptional regulator [uncultured Helcococcus sp.]|uniref:helix-turn-helix domain-containing protein n=1 Tax=uncultured Helcococcus sp. TaxID=1072508 RepID=UPI00262F8B0E|nr:helix-turn-helix transcriptional regulator [uncultured Helcococcus sp.]